MCTIAGTSLLACMHADLLGGRGGGVEATTQFRLNIRQWSALLTQMLRRCWLGGIWIGSIILNLRLTFPTRLCYTLLLQFSFSAQVE
jgi:hypothetical protein